MRINNNIMALNTFRQYGVNNSNVAKSAEKLSSGYRVNRAGDDAAGLAISEKMRAQIRGLNMASKNSQDAISLVQTTEGALQEVHSILQRIRELAVQSANDTNTDQEQSEIHGVDRQALDLEVAMLKEEITAIGRVTSFNGKPILDPESDLAGTALVMQTGANGSEDNDSIGGNYNRMDVVISSLSVETIGGFDLSVGENSDTLDVEAVDPAEDIADLSVATHEDAVNAIDSADVAINALSLQRALLGAYQNRLEHKVANLDTSAENLQAAESRIRDVDMAKEMSTFTKNNILSQAATAMLAQANQAPQNVLQLLR